MGLEPSWGFSPSWPAKEKKVKRKQNRAIVNKNLMRKHQ
ncbi:Hypothetical protein Minf_2077 [Methylacidiphilum infernorum V4]|uniref:Uncharacterized protein n=1 Tax=Methylacidiphilum infernorum (isolate V4) TaxID=481448 RepID=B3DZ39_METI4|nr:Hypothetical protein Minf_2077 [Methylacidiphilum infernorum V4]